MIQLLLTLKHTNSEREIESFKFDSRGGTIGRSVDCDWTIHDPDLYISNSHILISYQDKSFIITDTSTNGVYINSTSSLLGRGNAHKLKPEDVVIFGEYKLYISEMVLVESHDASSGSLLDLISSDQSTSEKSNNIQDPIVALTENDSFSDPSGNLEDILNTPPKLYDIEEEEDYKSAFPSPLSTESESNAPITADNNIPHDWELSGIMPSISESTLEENSSPSFVQSNLQDQEVIVAQVESTNDKIEFVETTSPLSEPRENNTNNTLSSHREHSDFFDLLYSKLGLPNEYKHNVNKESFAEDLANILLTSTSGYMSLLNGRSVFKQESRLSLTSIQPKSNNPIKFSIDPSDTLEMLLLKKKPGYLTAKESFDEAINDIQLHQMAFLAGLQASLLGVLNEISPLAIETSIKENNSSRIIGFKSSSQTWKTYEKKQKELYQKVDQNLNQILSDYFADAYQNQIDSYKKK